MPPPIASAFVAMVGVTEAGLEEFRVVYGMLDELRRKASPPVESFEFSAEGLDRLSKKLPGCAAMLMAPDLPTWSRLPHLNQLGPRPLRSAAHPFGLPIWTWPMQTGSTQNTDYTNSASWWCALSWRQSAAPT